MRIKIVMVVRHCHGKRHQEIMKVAVIGLGRVGSATALCLLGNENYRITVNR